MQSIPLPWGFSATVDDEDYDRLKKHKYLIKCSGHLFYAFRRVYVKGRHKNIYLHHEVLKLPNLYPKFFVDHINGDSLDCRRSNLQVVNRCQNVQKSRSRANGTSKYKGVSRDLRKYRVKKPWRTRLKTNGKIYNRYFKDEFSAMLCYNVMALCHFGEFAYLNSWNGPTTKEQDDNNKEK
jgi:hypothetical protein